VHISRAAKLAAVSAWVILEALGAFDLISTGYPLNNILFFGNFGLLVIIGLLIGRWRALLLVMVPGFLWLVAGLLEGSHIQLIGIVGIHVEPAILYGPFLVLGILLHKGAASRYGQSTSTGRLATSS